MKKNHIEDIIVQLEELIDWNSVAHQVMSDTSVYGTGIVKVDIEEDAIDAWVYATAPTRFNEYNQMLKEYQKIINAMYSIPIETKCECGSEKCGLPTHSSWCPKCKE